MYLFLLYAVIDLDCGLLVRPEEANNICSLWVQDVTIFITNNKVQLQDPAKERWMESEQIKEAVRATGRQQTQKKIKMCQ